MEKMDIILLLKVFENREFAEKFISGEIYCNSFHFFSNIEEDGKLRADKYEGASYIINPKEDTIDRYFKNKFNNDVEIFSLYFNKNKNKKMLSTYSIRRNEVKKDKYISLYIDKRMMKLGNYFVVIYDKDKFLERLKKEVEKIGVKYRIGGVKYKDIKNYTGRWDNFTKPLEYSYQKEYRVVIEGEDSQPEIINIESIKDIAKIYTLEEIMELNNRE